MADDKKDGSEEKSGGSMLGILENKAILLGIIVVVQALVAIGLTQFLIVPKMGIQGSDMSGQPGVEADAEMPEMGVLVGLNEIIVTLESNKPGKPRYLRIDINLEVKSAMIGEVVATRLPQLRDMVIMILSTKTAEDLSRPEGKKGLRDEIFRRLGEKLPPESLRNIYFSDLVIQ